MAEGSQARRFAIPVGVDVYQSSDISSPECPVPGGRRAREALLGAGYQAEHILLIADDQPDPRRLPTRQALPQHDPVWLDEKQPGPSDTALFPFRGHGVEDEERVDYALPQDADLGNPAETAGSLEEL
jgi:hypothetical protein